jgi:hypothetical protein
MSFIKQRIKRGLMRDGKQITCVSCASTSPCEDGFWHCVKNCDEDFCRKCGDMQVKVNRIVPDSQKLKTLLKCDRGHKLKFIGK